jgi:hypothetical protein
MEPAAGQVSASKIRSRLASSWSVVLQATCNMYASVPH